MLETLGRLFFSRDQAFVRRCSHGGCQAKQGLGRQQLGVQTFTQFTCLASIRSHEVVPEQLGQLHRGLTQQPFGGRSPSLDFKTRLRRAHRELELIPREIESVQAVGEVVLRSPIAELADWPGLDVPPEVGEVFDDCIEPQLAQQQTHRGRLGRQGFDLDLGLVAALDLGAFARWPFERKTRMNLSVRTAHPERASSATEPQRLRVEIRIQERSCTRPSQVQIPEARRHDQRAIPAIDKLHLSFHEPLAPSYLAQLDGLSSASRLNPPARRP